MVTWDYRGGRHGTLSLDCRVGATPPRNDKKGTGMAEVGSSQVFGRITPRCHCEPVRAWQSSLRRHAGCRGDAGVAQWFRWIAMSGLCPSFNDNGESGGRSGLSQFSSALFCRLVRDSLTSEPL
ncbi:MAG: hypothetical protein O3A82_12700 [Verrucomicrobia bacterium]|nr:hypothetical protein [Verrucomicrobiota bacterium]MDA1047776.1 hypothetical protein [Verrucomicrobiota bacterium]